MGRAEDGGAGLRNALPRQLGHDRQAQNIAGLALIGRHAQRGIALQMLDRPEVFLIGQLHILDGDIVLLIDPGASLALGHIPQRGDRHGRVFGFGQLMDDRGEAKIGQRLRRLGGPGLQRGMGGHVASGSPGHAQARRAVRAGLEGCNALVPGRATALVRGQAKVRVPAARNAQRAAANGMHAARSIAHGDRGQSKAARRIDDLGPLKLGQAGQARAVRA